MRKYFITSQLTASKSKASRPIASRSQSLLAIPTARNDNMRETDNERRWRRDVTHKWLLDKDSSACWCANWLSAVIYIFMSCDRLNVIIAAHIFFVVGLLSIWDLAKFSALLKTKFRVIHSDSLLLWRGFMFASGRTTFCIAMFNST